jgi:DNA-directed RNA polymerase specialized sigma24 family protein
MAAPLPAGPYQSTTLEDGTAIPWYLLPFDPKGDCKALATRSFLLKDAAEAEERNEAVRNTLADLRSRDTRILVRIGDGFSTQAIADEERLTVSAARKAKSRAKRRFAARLAARGIVFRRS